MELATSERYPYGCRALSMGECASIICARHFSSVLFIFTTGRFTSIFILRFKLDPPIAWLKPLSSQICKRDFSRASVHAGTARHA